MSLIGALNVGKTALAVHQAALQVTSNNVANAGNPDYTRQVARLTPAEGQQLKPGVFTGGGINLAGIERQIDDALEGRIRGGISDSQSADTQQQWIGRVEAVFNELGDSDLSTQLSAFFNSWSNLANKPQDIGLRQIVVQNGQSLAAGIRGLRSQLGNLQTDVDLRLTTVTRDVDALAQKVAGLNQQISTAEGGAGASAKRVRDQRDAALKQMSQLLDIKVQDTGNGMVNVLVGSEPLVLGATNRGAVAQQVPVNGELRTTLQTRDDETDLKIDSGQLGGLLGARGEISDVIDQLDTLAGNLVFEVNKLHSAGQGIEGTPSATASNAVNDVNAALNTTQTGLAFKPVNGSFVVHVKQKGSGLVSSTLVEVDLDGSGGNDTSLETLRQTLDGISGVSASISAGKLSIKADSSDVLLNFSQDSSGTLAALGINSYFTGKDARDIAVRGDLKDQPSLLAASKNGQAGDNQTALAIAAMETAPLTALGGASLKDKYESMINGIAVSAASAKTNSEAAQAVVDTLSSQREALSGVSLDEEAINLIREQRAFQAAARVISTVDEMMRTLLQLT